MTQEVYLKSVQKNSFLVNTGTSAFFANYDSNKDDSYRWILPDDAPLSELANDDVYSLPIVLRSKTNLNFLSMGNTGNTAHSEPGFYNELKLNPHILSLETDGPETNGYLELSLSIYKDGTRYRALSLQSGFPVLYWSSGSDLQELFRFTIEYNV